MASASGAALPAARPPSSVKSGFIEILVVTVIAAAIGVAFAIARPARPVQEAAQAAQDEASPKSGAAVIDLPPIVTNIANPSDTWIRMEISIIFDADAVSHPEVDAALISGDALAYLRTLSISQIEGPIGLQTVRADLNERAKIRSGAKVKELVVRAMVVQ
jgi:flagellar FliL protein